MMSLRAMLYRRPAEPAVIEVAEAGIVYRVRLRRHRLARRFTLRIHAPTQEAVLTMPPRGSLRDAEDFARRNAGWIAARLRRLAPIQAFDDGMELPLRGARHRIRHRPDARGVVWLETGEADRELLLCVAGDARHLDRRVRDFLKAEARRDLRIAVDRHAAALGVRPRRLSVRDQSSRWGSCSATGSLSFSWRLIFAPPFVLDYLAAHEVAHLIEMNHSRAFWRLTTKLTPHVAQARLWLDRHGTELHRYGAPPATPSA